MSHIEGRKAPTYFGLQAKRNLADTPASVAVKANRQSVRDVGARRALLRLCKALLQQT